MARATVQYLTLPAAARAAGKSENIVRKWVELGEVRTAGNGRISHRSLMSRASVKQRTKPKTLRRTVPARKAKANADELTRPLMECRTYEYWPLGSRKCQVRKRSA